jgi:outer membrane autotransporter protein
MGYDIKTTKRSVLTPSVKATYDYIKFDDIKDNSGKKVVFDDIHDIELEAGMKFEYQFNEKHQLPTTGYIKPSFVHVVSNGGDVTVNNTIFEDNLEDGNYWRVEIGADADIIRNFSIGGFGNYTSGSGYDAWTIGGHIRYIW